jgi:hypothetical protein
VQAKKEENVRTIILFLFCFFVAGCVTTSRGLGSSYWYEDRLAEIEDSFNKGRLSKAEYLELKSETDRIRQDYLIRNDYYYDPSPYPYPYRFNVYYGYGHQGHRRGHHYYHH